MASKGKLTQVEKYMTMFFNHQRLDDTFNKHSSSFDLNDDLKEHAWHPRATADEAVAFLEDQIPYTYLLRPSDRGRGFAISFVQPNGHIKHDYFTLIDPRFGIYRNGLPHHVGKLEKVIRDMMECSFDEGAPLESNSTSD